jgi:hypothetical protein
LRIPFLGSIQEGHPIHKLEAISPQPLKVSPTSVETGKANKLGVHVITTFFGSSNIRAQPNPSPSSFFHQPRITKVF